MRMFKNYRRLGYLGASPNFRLYLCVCVCARAYYRHKIEQYSIGNMENLRPIFCARGKYRLVGNLTLGVFVVSLLCGKCYLPMFGMTSHVSCVQNFD